MLDTCARLHMPPAAVAMAQTSEVEAKSKRRPLRHAHRDLNRVVSRSALLLTSAGMGFLRRVLPAERKESKTLRRAQVGLRGL